MDPGFLKLPNDDEQDDNSQPPAADVDAFAAVLKGELGGAAHAAAAAGYGVARTGNGTVQPVPPSPAASVTTGTSGIKPVPLAPTPTSSSQQQLLWNQITPEQQQQLYHRRVIQQRLQQIQQQPHQQNASSARKGPIREGISFTALMPLLQPHLPAEQGQQLSGLYQRFKRNEISREDFIRGARVIAGDSVLLQTIREMHGKSTKSQQLLSPIVSATSSQQSKEAGKQNLQPQTNQPPSQILESIVGNAAQRKLPLGHLQAHPVQQTQMPSSTDLKTLPPGSQPPSYLPEAQLKSSSVKQGDRHGQDLGQE